MATKKGMKWPVIAGIGFMAAFLAWMAWSTLGNAQYRCQVSVTFGGRTITRNGAATTREQAERIAVDGACTDLSSGMTRLLQCQNSAERIVNCKQ